MGVRRARRYDPCVVLGDREAEQWRFANGADLSAKAQAVNAAGVVNCDDKYAETSRTGSFRPNKFGLYDMSSKVGQWVEDCFHNIRTPTMPQMAARLRLVFRNSTTLG